MSDEIPTTDEYIAEVKKEMADDAQESGTNAVALAGIVMAGFVVIICILACALVMYAFLQNAPWQAETRNNHSNAYVIDKFLAG